jgi:signal transduction histidine kinase
MEGQALIAEVQEWGRGFEMDQIGEERESLGLLGMRERAEMLGGNLFIDSAPGQGTTILAAIRLREIQMAKNH